MSFVYWIPVFTGMAWGAVPIPRKWESSRQAFLIRSSIIYWTPGQARNDEQVAG